MTAAVEPGYAAMIDSAPRWTWRLVLISALFSAAFLLVLPMMESVSHRPTPTHTLRTVEPVALMPSLVVPPPVSVENPQVATAVDKMPELEVPVVKMPLHTILDLELGARSIKGDFNLSFTTLGPTEMGTSTGSSLSVASLDLDPRAINRLKPLYPASARSRGVEGSVKVTFLVNVDGRTKDIRVLSSEPGTLFVNATIRAVRRWKFAPAMMDGNPVSAKLVQVITYRLEN
jgi:TonB family protein